MLTKDILFGMNVLSLAGFLVMGLSLYLIPHGKRGYPLEHWANVRRDRSGIFRAVFGGLVKLAVVDEGEQVAEQLGEQFHGSSPKTRQRSENNQAWTRQADRRGQEFPSGG